MKLENGKLTTGRRTLISGIPKCTTAVPDPSGVGLFLRFAASEPAARLVFPLGVLENLDRFTCCHRYEPFWMKPVAGTRAGQVPIETQFLLCQFGETDVVLFVPLIDRALTGAFRASLQGAGERGLELVAESGDPAVAAAEMVGLFVAAGKDPYELMERAAESVSTALGTCRLAREKLEPDFLDYFGWCTWDAFYQEVSHDKVREGLASFQAAGVPPGYLILDDGWQEVVKRSTGETRLSSFAANGKFPGGLGHTIRMAKEEFSITQFFVWHAMTGYWGGVDGETLPGYGAKPVARSFSPGILQHRPTMDEWWGGVVGVVPPDQIYRFFHDYHRCLRAEGVDGVKVDTQATLEGVAAGFGGRVEMTRRYREALEGSAQVHFEGNLINCMSCSSEMLYGALASTVTRTSTDFWPNRPESHGEHLYTNAQVSLWFGEFIRPDWDMFQSGHAMGGYHAAGRAVSGGPVYVSDKPGEHDAGLLRKLVLKDGRIARCLYAGRPSRDCLFRDPTREDVLLKIFNSNTEGHILGVFHARASAEGEADRPIAGAIALADIDPKGCDRFAVYAHRADELRLMTGADVWEITLAPNEYEVFTFVAADPAVRQMALIGISDLFNSSGVVEAPVSDMVDPTGVRWGYADYRVDAIGHVIAWCERAPSHLWTGLSGPHDPTDSNVPFLYDEQTHRLDADLPEGSDGMLHFYFDFESPDIGGPATRESVTNPLRAAVESTLGKSRRQPAPAIKRDNFPH